MYRFIFIAFLLLPSSLFAQKIHGVVTGKNDRPIAGASIHWLGSSQAVLSDKNGQFDVLKTDSTTNILVASHVGYQTDTLPVISKQLVTFRLKEKTALEPVIIFGERDGISISDRNPIKTEQITQKELGKAACCDLAGCFETQATVQPQTTNVITNAKELRILGLSGVYNQVLIDGFPLIQGLTYTYGISSIPGSLVDNIYVAKGANSVLQGFEGMSGQINVETKDPDQTDRLYLNAYTNNFLEKHFNANYAFSLKETSHLTALHIVQPANKIDRDDDGFLDLPLLTRYMVSHKWNVGDDQETGGYMRMGLRYLDEERIGGQKNYDRSYHKGSNSVYGQSVRIQQPELWIKTGYRFNEQHQLILFASAYKQQQASYFGTVKYDATQQNFYGNVQYEYVYKNHVLKAGISYRYLNLQEQLGFTDLSLPRTYAGRYQRQENIPGIFAENTFRFFDEKLTWITGIRADHHNQFGMKVTPRTLLKYDITPKTIIRANVGTGWRTVNVFSENIGLLVSSRDIVFAEPLNPETSLNLGLNITQKFELKEGFISGYVSADFYRTQFSNQIFPDYDSDPTKAILKNFTGNSVSNGFQAELFLKCNKRFEWKSGYTFLDVYRVVDNAKKLLPFNSRHKWLNSFSYKPLTNKFHIDMNVHTYGQQRLPNTQSNPIEFQRADFSNPYTVINFQVTLTFPKIEIYTGCENVFDFRQRRPILSWQNPFGPYFDTSSVWGPTRGRELYMGIRYRLAD